MFRSILAAVRHAADLSGGLRKLPLAFIRYFRSYGVEGLSKAVLTLWQLRDDVNVGRVQFEVLGDRSTWLASALKEAAQIEQKLSPRARTTPKNQVVLTPQKTAYSESIKRLMTRLEVNPPDVVIFIGRHQTGGANLVAMNIARGLAESKSLTVAVIGTDGVSTLGNRRTFETTQRVESLEIVDSLRTEQKLGLAYLVSTLNSVRYVFTVNSYVGYELLARYGRLISMRGKQTYAAFFCPDLDKRKVDRSFGSRYFSKLNGVVTGFISDHSHYISMLSSETPEVVRNSKLVVLRQPADLPLLADSTLETPLARNEVLWASRLADQKGYMLLKNVAKKCPDLKFNVYGEGSRLAVAKLMIFAPRNLEYKGAYRGFSSINLTGNPIFLYTGKWDGIPNVLLEAAAHGLPIVSSAVGGIGEFLGENRERGQLVSRADDVDEYALRLREAASDSIGTLVSARNARDFLVKNHSWDTFKRALKKTLIS